MLTFEQMQEILTDIADSIPLQIYRELNGGIVLHPDTRMHPKSIGEGLYILGQYHYEPLGFGRYIHIYYGSFCKVHGQLPDELQKEKLKELLYHELTHHLEHLAGDKSLEIQDAIDIAKYRQERRGTDK